MGQKKKESGYMNTSNNIQCVTRSQTKN